MESSTFTILAVLAIFLHLQGWMYAIQILNTPTEPGWTWTSVGTGTSMVTTGEMFAIFILFHFDALTLIPAMLTSPAVLLLIGIPMATLQIYKKRRADQKSKKIEKEQNFVV